MAGMGPPPNPQSRRQSGKPALAQLPAEGRKGPVPGWPLGEQSDREAELWAEVWSLPQAVMWEHQNVGREVGLYVRWSVKAEDGHIGGAKEARQLADRLGLTPLALLRLHWEVVADEVAEKRATTKRERKPFVVAS